MLNVYRKRWSCTSHPVSITLSLMTKSHFLLLGKTTDVHGWIMLNPTCSDLKSHEQKQVIMFFSSIWQLISASFMDFRAFSMDLTGKVPTPPSSGSRPIAFERRWKRSRRHPRLGSLGAVFPPLGVVFTHQTWWVHRIWESWWFFMGFHMIFNGFLQIQKDSNGIQ